MYVYIWWTKVIFLTCKEFVETKDIRTLSFISRTKCYWRDITRVRDLLLLGLVYCVLFFLANATWWVSCAGVWRGHATVLCLMCAHSTLISEILLPCHILWSPSPPQCRHYIGQGWAWKGALNFPACPSPSLGSPVPWRVVSHGFTRIDTTHSRSVLTVALRYSLSYQPTHQAWFMCIPEDCFLLAR